MSKFADKKFWIDAGDRALSSFAQGIIGATVLDSTGVIGVDWVGVASLGAGYAALSLLQSIAFRAPTTPDDDEPGRHEALKTHG